MGILMWDKPKRVQSKEDWKEGYGFEDGPTGGYMPNMSEDDAQRWKAKLVGTKTGFPQVEIRKSAGPALMTVIVNLGYGYNYKQYTVRSDQDYSRSNYLPRKSEYYRMIARTTEGVQIHMSANGPMQMTFEDFENMKAAIAEAKAKLEEHLGQTGEWGSYLLKAGQGADLDTIKDLAVKAGAIHYDTFSERRFVWIAATDSIMEAVNGIAGIREIEPRAAMLARNEAFTKTDRYWDRLESFE